MKSPLVTDYTREELLQIENFKTELPYNAFVIVPTGKMHDGSIIGWMDMKIILLDCLTIVGAISGHSDVINLNGIGGYGLDFEKTADTGKTDRISWNIDILGKSGCVRVFCDTHYLEIDPLVLSNLEIFVKTKRR